MRAIALLLIFAFATITYAEPPESATEQEAIAEPTDAELEARQQEYLAWVKSFLESLDYQRGEISLADGVATLTVPDDYYYLTAADTERLLTEAWGNPPGSQTLGMLMPGDVSPLAENSWGVMIEYVQDGYVSDEDADEIDYDDMLKQMQEDTRSSNSERLQAGYDTVELVGWASQPHYDRSSRKLHWAKELKFGDSPDHTLNYSTRILGRKGYLELNFIAGMNQLSDIKNNVDSVLKTAEFNDGYRYDQFDPSIDQVAAYGIGALVAGKVLVKTGLVAAALIFFKKFGVIIVVVIAGIGARLFSRRKKEA